MNKELEALEIECGELVEMDLLFLDRNGKNQEKWHNSEAFKKAVEFEKKYGKSHTYILKSALQRLEAIDNANPSEALKCLDDIYRNGVFISDYDALGKQHPTNISPETNKSISEQCETIKQALLKAQEQDFNYKNIVLPFFNELVNLFGNNDTDEMLDKIKEQNKVLEILKPYLRLVNNYLQVKAIFYDDLWMTVKEIDDEEELEVLKKILGQTQI